MGSKFSNLILVSKFNMCGLNHFFSKLNKKFSLNILNFEFTHVQNVYKIIDCSVKAGCAALPPLLNIKQVMQQRQCTGVWAAKDELPVSIITQF